MPESKSQHRQSVEPFQGFEPLTANYVYCPNQFFDVLLPHGSRGCVRLVAHLLRRTLGWLDANGEPIEQEISVTWRELIEHAGISRGALKDALTEAMNGGFIDELRSGKSKSSGSAGQSGQYRLKWGSATEYVKSPSDFDGFYAGEGHRTPVPNAFFDRIVPVEPLAVTKVVGTVLRHTIGYQNQFGGRRSSAPLSYQLIANYARLSNGKTLSQAIQSAESAGYIQRLESGIFSPDVSQQQATTYGVRWLQAANSGEIGSKIPAETNRSKIPSRNGSESPAEHRFKNPSSRKTTNKDTLKQQPAAAWKEGIQLLIEAGLDRGSATKLVKQQGMDVVRNQLDWLDARNPTENRVGMLRKAIQENWEKPQSIVQQERRNAIRQRHRQQDVQQVQEDAQIKQQRAARHGRQQQLLTEWGIASLADRRRWIAAAVERETSSRLADIIRREAVETAKPHLQVLESIAVERQLPRIVQSENC
ncbi:MAG: hypothetical protein R3C18_13985 [Planctomycetaceae bacterium]